MLNYLQSINSTLWIYMMLLTMTDIEIYRINTIKNVIDKRISGVDAAALLNLSTRQVYRLTKQYLKHGTEVLI
ncbi:helix-turn-helix domain-containing protein, partial [Moritella viscosa]